MQKVVIVNLNGIAYHLEEGAFAALGSYLKRAAAQLRANPDRSEILEDLEQAIADKFGRYRDARKNVVTAADMATILDEMGPVREEADAAGAPGARADDAAQPGDAAGNPTAVRDEPGDRRTGSRRLYRMLDSGVVGGVCSGFAVFLSTDVTLVRIVLALAGLFEFVFLHTPFVLLAYLVALFVIPAAGTSEQRAAARGIPFNAQLLIDEAKRNFAKIGDHDWRRTRRERQTQSRWATADPGQHGNYTWPAAAPIIGYGSQIAAGVMIPVLTLLSVCAFWAMAYVAVSLASTGGVGRWQLPADVPLWLGLVGMLFLYSALAWPLHALRRASYYQIGGPDHRRYEAFDQLISAILGVAIVWIAYRHSPEIREWLRHLPDAWHNVVASFRS